MKKFLLNTESILLMGIINATEDSFSGDGIYQSSKFDIKKEIDSMLKNGVDIVDIGGESTRPKVVYGNVIQISEEEELDRVIPIIEEISKNFEITISIDSKKSKVLEEAIKAGAEIANDISMFKDKKILDVISRYQVYYVLNHYRQNSKHTNVLPEVLGDFSDSIDKIIDSGLKREKIILDPGIGFGKKHHQSKDIFSNIEIIKKSFNLPVMVGPSRKSFIGEYTGKTVDQRIFGTAATVAFGILNSANIIRVHDYKEMIDVKKMTEKLQESSYKS